MKHRTFYYTDPLNDDFAGTNIKTKQMPPDYKYLHDRPLRRAAAWVLHHIVATPLCWIFLKVGCGQKIVGRKKLKPYRKSGYFLYGNHTRTAGDAFTPSMVAFPKKPYLIVHPDTLSLPGLRRVVEDLGAMPIPQGYEMQKNFMAAVDEHAKRGNVVAIYPEAHIWPLYTGIRPFSDVSFAYPVRTGKPVFTFTATYSKRKLFGGVKATVYVDGPFFPDESLPVKERKADLRNKVFAAMEERAKLSDYSPNTFVQK